MPSRLSPTLLLLLGLGLLHADPSDGYYDSAQGKSGRRLPEAKDDDEPLKQVTGALKEGSVRCRPALRFGATGRWRRSSRAFASRTIEWGVSGRIHRPGKFVDIGEPTEDGLRHEIKEEVNLETTYVQFLCFLSNQFLSNQYFYRDANYPFLDFFFIARAGDASGASAAGRHEKFCVAQSDRPARRGNGLHSNRLAL
jgi:hypothetical protein